MPTVSARWMKDTRRLLVTLRDNPSHGFDSEARALLERVRERKPIRKELDGPSRQEAREARRKRHAEETARIREAVFARAGGRCEWTDGGARCSNAPVHLHHTEGGSGRRRQRQSVANTLALCMGHHVDAHRASKRANGGEP